MDTTPRLPEDPSSGSQSAESSASGEHATSHRRAKWLWGISACSLGLMLLVLVLLSSESGPFSEVGLPPWGNMPLADAVAEAARNEARWKRPLADYVIAPPDILMFDAIKAMPKSPYHLQRGDTLNIDIADPPLRGEFVVDVDGQLTLGPTHENLPVVGLTIVEAREVLKNHLAKTVAEPQFSLALNTGAIERQIAGEHLVSPDGTINLGTYGAVQVSGLTIAGAKAAVEAQLSDVLEQPRVAIDVFAYNSQVYYVIIESYDGDTLTRVPITGNETVLDALAAYGIKELSNQHVWIARPAVGAATTDEILPVDMPTIITEGSTFTNYQVMPGDRIFVAEKPSTGRRIRAAIAQIYEAVTSAGSSASASPTGSP